jgi:hypothetical protein
MTNSAGIVNLSLRICRSQQPALMSLNTESLFALISYSILFKIKCILVNILSKINMIIIQLFCIVVCEVVLIYLMSMHTT